MPYITEHFCRFTPFSKSGVPKLSPSASLSDSIKWFLKCMFIISPYNRQTIYYFDSTAKLEFERQFYLDSKKIVIHPLSIFTQYWQFMMCFILHLNILLGLSSPIFRILVNFDDFIFNGMYSLYFITLIICTLHILVSFFTGYIEKQTKRIEIDRKKIALRYLTRNFFIDFLAFDYVFVLTLQNFKFYTPFAIVYTIAKILRLSRLKDANIYLKNLTVYCGLSDGQFRAIKV